MAKGARHRVDEPGSHRWRPDIDKHPRSLIEGWAAATDAVRGRATAELPCTRPRGDHGREVRSTRCTRTAGACMTVACESGQGQCQSGKEFSKDDRVIRDILARQQGIVLWSCGAHGPRSHCPLRGKSSWKSYPRPVMTYVLDETGRGTIHTRFGRLEVHVSRFSTGYRFKSLWLSAASCTHEGKAKPLGNPTNGNEPTIVGARPLGRLAWPQNGSTKHDMGMWPP